VAGREKGGVGGGGGVVKSAGGGGGGVPAWVSLTVAEKGGGRKQE